ncbi:hypothetical protein LZF95_04030 [Algoriphagus sp. AGSA1]|uniref:hypothetical protein n=1 Tax=Algoriphagus sp. AGSA1 TaxID=2907213 RepID=UPI001F19581E|nr:hypothetical protein [Algoriphagus sp. AGSA1]MCE7053836.1 hypothetical protein [Algoriphagus sp. AGSA1]
MNNLPDIKDFKAPDGYFESLPDRIIRRIPRQQPVNWFRYAAAIAVLLVSWGVWQINTSKTDRELLTLEDEVNLYIESQYWTAEDVLSMVDNPEEILDQIIAEEMIYEVDFADDNIENWY